MQKKYMKVTYCIIFLLLMFSLAGCDIIDAILTQFSDTGTDAITVLEDAIQALDQNSSDWQSIVEDAIDELTGTADDVVARLELTLGRAVAQTGMETRCTLDFIGDRVKEEIKNILAELKGETPTPLRPQVCTAVPDNVTADQVPYPLTHVGFYGYNFDLGPQLQAFIERSNGARVNVTSKLNMPTHYSMTLPFGSTGAPITQDDQRIIVTWDGELLVSVGITQPPPRECEIREIVFTPSPITFTPTNHTQGDKDFGGNGPEVTGYVMLLTTHYSSPSGVNRAKIRVYMKARETKSDWTTVSGSQDFDIRIFPAGFMLWQRLSPLALRSNYSYTDNDHSKDTVYPGEGPARKLVITGDTEGNDVGITKVEIHFNEIGFLLKEVGDCQ